MISANAGSTVTLQNNCFFENNFQTLGIVNLETENSISDISNNFGAKDDDGLTCHFVHVMDGQCREFDLQECPIDGVDAPPVKATSGQQQRGCVVTMMVMAFGMHLLLL